MQSPFSTWLIMSNFSTILIFKSLTHFGKKKKKAMLLYGKLLQPRHCITDIINPHKTYGMTVTTFCYPTKQAKCCHRLSMPNPIRPKIITYHLCQIALNRKLLHKFKKWCKFSSYIKVKLRKKNITYNETCVYTNSNQLH